MSPTPHSAVAPSAAAGGRILLVEDDHDTAFFVAHVLEKRGGFQVTHTPDPAAALALAAAGPWDLVITDLELPAMSGLELTGALRQLAPLLPVMIVTAHEAAARGTAVRAAGCPVLVKPLRVDQLLSAATTLMSV
jgi:DNA-binding response OmpR family regulator